MKETTPKQQRFQLSLRESRAHRQELLELLIEKINQEDSVELQAVPVNMTTLVSLDYDINLLKQLLDIEQ